MSFSRSFLDESIEIISRLDADAIDRMAIALGAVRDRGGRLFIVGVGGSAGHASHAVNDFRKICGLEAYTPTDNVSELTARINDDGWEESYASWLRTSRLSRQDALLVFSVGGGNVEKNVSVNLVRSIDEAKRVGRMCGGAGGERPAHHAAHRGALRCGLACAGHPSGTQGVGDEVGVGGSLMVVRRFPI